MVKRKYTNYFFSGSSGDVKVIVLQFGGVETVVPVRSSTKRRAKHTLPPLPSLI